LAKEGWVFIIVGLGVGAVLARSFGVTGPGYGVSALGLGFALFCGYFFRDPERPYPTDQSLLYSPGDGRVLTVGPESERPGVTVRIFLSIFDVHIQRFPCWGTVRDVHAEEGGFVAAMKPEADKNMRNVVHIAQDSRPGEVIVEQITGLIARRIRCWTDVGDRAEAGRRYGLIMFGSQVAVHLPPDVRPTVKPGDRVTGGVTPIGEWTKKN